MALIAAEDVIGDLHLLALRVVPALTPITLHILLQGVRGQLAAATSLGPLARFGLEDFLAHIVECSRVKHIRALRTLLEFAGRGENLDFGVDRLHVHVLEVIGREELVVVGDETVSVGLGQVFFLVEPLDFELGEVLVVGVCRKNLGNFAEQVRLVLNEKPARVVHAELLLMVLEAFVLAHNLRRGRRRRLIGGLGHLLPEILV